MEEPKAKPRLMAPPGEGKQERSLILGLSLLGGLLASPIKLLQFIVMYWKVIFIGGLIGIVAYQNFSQVRYFLWADTIPYLRNQIVELEAQNDEILKANELLVVRIQKTNQTIMSWKRKSDALQAKLDKLNTSIVEHQEDVAEDVAEILQGPTPPDCKASIEYLIDATGDLQWDIK